MSSDVAVISDGEIEAIIARVRGRVADIEHLDDAGAALAAADELASGDDRLGDGIHPTIDAAVAAAHRAFLLRGGAGLDARRVIIEAIRAAMRREGERLAHLAHQETGIGRADDKTVKNRLVTERTPGPEDLEPQVVTGDQGMMVTEYAPYGVIGSITPTTNPTSTIINNAIAMISAGNAVTFNVHPSARNVSVETIQLINRAVVAAGGPPDLVTATPTPTLESARELMNHPDVVVLLVTGGPAVVREALRTPKKAITAGPGNPPAVVDQTADVEQAGRDIVRGASFDNNVICTDAVPGLLPPFAASWLPQRES
ncbi:MAG: aldehyde dehydrogenase family protein, partial [Acidimicrobiales bacterium]